MSAPVTPAVVAALHSVDPTADTARVYVDTATPDRAAVKAAAKVAARALHTIVGKPLTVTPGDGGAYVVFPAIRTRKAAAPAAVPTPERADAAPVASGPRSQAVAGVVETLRKLSPETLAAVVAALTEEAPAPAAAPAREVPEFIKRAQAVTCRTCRDHGVVRGVGARAGQPYRTADGAAAAKAAGRAAKCPTHKRAARKSA